MSFSSLEQFGTEHPSKLDLGMERLTVQSHQALPKATSLCTDLKLAFPPPSLKPGFQTLILGTVLCTVVTSGEEFGI